MKFTTREDIEAPIDFVYSQVSDFETFERQALRRGADVRRVDQAPKPVPGSAWDVSFTFRGKDRKMRASLSQIDEPQLIAIDTAAAGLDSLASIELVPLSPNRTRIAVSIDLSAKSLSARLLLQSLKLAKNGLNKKFKNRVAEFASDVEGRYRRG